MTTDVFQPAQDRTIRHTDAVRARMIALLAARDDLDGALVSVSDHGESPDEGGLYLHGTPWFMTPEEQTRGPRMVWMSDGYAATVGLDPACLSARAALPGSHDGVFHSVLGLMDVQTGVRKAGPDLFGARRAGAR